MLYLHPCIHDQFIKKYCHLRNVQFKLIFKFLLLRHLFMVQSHSILARLLLWNIHVPKLYFHVFQIVEENPRLISPIHVENNSIILTKKVNLIVLYLIEYYYSSLGQKKIYSKIYLYNILKLQDMFESKLKKFNSIDRLASLAATNFNLD